MQQHIGQVNVSCATSIIFKMHLREQIESTTGILVWYLQLWWSSPILSTAQPTTKAMRARNEVN